MRIVISSVLSLGTLLSVVTGFTSAQPPPAPVAASPSASVVVYTLPVPGPARVLEPFEPPLTRYAAGHRGVDLATPRRGQVRAAADGIVRFAGPVGGRGVVVVLHADGIATEYEPLRPAVRAGARVRRGMVIGSVSGRHRSCPRDACVHWAARRGEVYLDPMSLLGTLSPVRLLPWPP